MAVIGSARIANLFLRGSYINFQELHNAWFNFACYHPPPPPRGTPGKIPALQARGWGIDHFHYDVTRAKVSGSCSKDRAQCRAIAGKCQKN